MPKLIGEATRRVEDRRLLCGVGEYVSDLKLENMLYAKVLRSPYARAKIRGIRVSKTKQLPGVVTVLTGKEARTMINPCHTHFASNISEPIFPLAIDMVNYVGHEVAAVAATDPAIAEDALELIEVDYEPLSPVMNPEEAMKSGAPLVRSDVPNSTSNISFQFNLVAGDAQRAFEDADCIVQEKFETGRQHLAPLEPSAAVGWYDSSGNRLTLWANTQVPFSIRRGLSEAFGLSENRIRVVVPDMGGGFGARVRPYSHNFVPCILSKITGRPVKIVLDRSEDLLASGHRNGSVANLSMALRKDGRVTGLRGRVIWDTGAWHGAASGSLTKGLLQMAGPYKIENVRLEGFCVYTNRSLTDASRGYGQPQCVFFRERMLDMAAKRLDMDPLELRLVNVIKSDEIPYASSTGPLFDSPHIADCLKRAADAVSWDRIRKEKSPGIGIGLALYQKNNGGYQSHGYGAPNTADYDTAMIKIEPDASVEVSTGAVAQGQGHQTFITQVVAEELGVDPEKITVIYGDTDRTPYGMGTFASRTAVITGGAVHLACSRIREKIMTAMAYSLGVKEEDLKWENGSVALKGQTDKRISLQEIAKMFYTNPTRLPKSMEPGLTAISTYDPPGKVPFDENGRCQIASSYDIGAYAVVVKVDSETGDFEILDQALAYDCGRTINPMIVEGQHHGALAHGLGMAMFESLEWDSNGQPLNHSFVDFLTPTAVDIPVGVKLIKFESHPMFQKWGYRGVGESGTIPVTAAIANALSNALGFDLNKAPINPEEIHALLQKNRKQ